MTIEVLTCYADGRQVLEQREVPEDYFPPLPLEEEK